MAVLFLLLALVLYLLPGLLRATAQGKQPLAEGLAVGQRVPDVRLEMVNYHAPSARLSDFKGKLLLLDFWATWCGNCKAAMPRLEAIQKEFGDQVQVLLVNSSDTQEKVEAYFDKWRAPDGNRFRLASAVNGAELGRLFPHKLIPHVVWIDPEGTLKATTSTDEVTPANIRKMLHEGNPQLVSKVDKDLERPLFTEKDLPEKDLLHYSILLQGWVEGVPSGSKIRRNGQIVRGAAITNTPILDMFKIAKQALYPELGQKGLVLDVQHAAPLVQEESGLSKERWLKENAYSYDLVVPEGKADAMFSYMLEDLNKYSGYRASLEQREQDCLLLVRKGRKNHLQTKGGQPQNRLFQKDAPAMQNLPVSMLVGRLNSSGLPQLVVDNTGYTGNIDLVLTTIPEDLPSLRRELQTHGLDLKKSRRKASVLVLRHYEGSDEQNQTKN